VPEIKKMSLRSSRDGAAGLALLAEGHAAGAALQNLLAGDAGRAHRQVHLLPASGAPAAHTGAQCIEWCGHRLFDDSSVAGNMPAGPQVIDATARTYRESATLPFAERLIAALRIQRFSAS
jgi:uncharacterized Ntn-hydrolase superfamily protein